MNKTAEPRILVTSERGVTLVAGGPVGRSALAAALALAPVLVAADGGADRALRLGHPPQAVIGDLDSLSARARAALPAARIHAIAEQETTDFDKALRSVAAPFVLALGVLGGRVDHELAAFTTLVRRAERPVLALGARDVVLAAPARPLRLHLRRGDRLSLYPLGPVSGRDRGLVWPIAGLDFAATGRIGTSNRVAQGPVDLHFDRPGMLVILPRARAAAALAALLAAT